ncbi:MAG TPA: excalibur calcium-binding domain-containing protein [Sphingomicrobium sp.]|nr:excalibur calcium-binding domain-containing protein [Sphingomicrobium sp.]
MKLRYIFGLAASPLVAVGAFTSPASAHGGGLNSEGCHNDRKNGGYHCHRSGKLSLSDNNKTPAGNNGGAFRNCTAARNAGAAPARRGDAGYGPHLDRDDDGVGCE